MPVLEVRAIRAAYGSVEVLHGVDLRVDPGQVVAVLGPNGAGKSTTMRVIAGLHRPTRGEVYMAGRRVTGARAEELARRGVCTIPEGRGIFPNLTVREHLRMATHAGVGLAAVEERAFARFPRLRDRRDQTAGTMSGGEQQMLAMARALATDPALLILDELSMGLAPLVVDQLYDVVRTIAADGVSILVVEQFARTVLSVCDVAAVMIGGRVTMVDRPAAVAAALSDAYLGA